MTQEAGTRSWKVQRLETLVRARIRQALDRNGEGAVESADRIRALVTSQRKRWLRLREAGTLTRSELRSLELGTWRYVRSEIVRRQLREREKERAAAEEQRHQQSLRQRLAQFGDAARIFDPDFRGETICVLPMCARCGKSPLHCACPKS